MPTFKTELSNVIYNAALQSFEANVVIHDPNGRKTYACSIEAPVTLPFEDAATWLTEQALLRHSGTSGLHMFLAPGASNHPPAKPNPPAKPKQTPSKAKRAATKAKAVRRGLPLGQYGFFRGRAA